jgi:hypothetical protein
MGEPLVDAPTKTCPACAEAVKAEAQVCRFCGHEFGMAVAASPTPPTFAAPTVPASPERHLGRRLLLALVLVVVVVAGVFVARALLVGEASSPSDLADRFEAAGVICQDYDVIFDDRESKALGCAAEAAQIITITTYADRPSEAEWLGLRCDHVVAGLGQGAYVFGDDFIIDIVQGSYPADLVTPPPIEAVAQNLATELGGTVGTYDCLAAG